MESKRRALWDSSRGSTRVNSHAIVFISTSGEQVAELTIPASTAAFAKAIKAAQKLGDVACSIEGTGSYGRGFAEALVARGYTVYEIPGSFTKRARKLGSRPGKSDILDARAIADVVLRESRRLPRFEESDQPEAIRLHYDRRDRQLATVTYYKLREVHRRLQAAPKAPPASARITRGATVVKAV